jgi:transposase
MPAALSMDLRERVLAAYRAGEGSYSTLAARFQLGVATVNRWVNRFAKTGTVAPSPHGGGKEGHLKSRLEDFKQLVGEHADATLAQLAEFASHRYGESMSPAAISRALKRARITRKKRR